MPKYAFSNVPPMKIGMGDEAAKHNGYIHGFQSFVTENFCDLTKGTSEHEKWIEGYREGDNDSYNEFLQGELEFKT